MSSVNENSYEEEEQGEEEDEDEIHSIERQYFDEEAKEVPVRPNYHDVDANQS